MEKEIIYHFRKFLFNRPAFQKKVSKDSRFKRKTPDDLPKKGGVDCSKTPLDEDDFCLWEAVGTLGRPKGVFSHSNLVYTTE